MWSGNEAPTLQTQSSGVRSQKYRGPTHLTQRKQSTYMQRMKRKYLGEDYVDESFSAGPASSNRALKGVSRKQPPTCRARKQRTAPKLAIAQKKAATTHDSRKEPPSKRARKQRAVPALTFVPGETPALSINANIRTPDKFENTVKMSQAGEMLVQLMNFTAPKTENSRAVELLEDAENALASLGREFIHRGEKYKRSVRKRVSPSASILSDVHGQSDEIEFVDLRFDETTNEVEEPLASPSTLRKSINLPKQGEVLVVSGFEIIATNSFTGLKQTKLQVDGRKKKQSMSMTKAEIKEKDRIQKRGLRRLQKILCSAQALKPRLKSEEIKEKDQKRKRKLCRRIKGLPPLPILPASNSPPNTSPTAANNSSISGPFEAMNDPLVISLMKLKHCARMGVEGEKIAQFGDKTQKEKLSLDMVKAIISKVACRIEKTSIPGYLRDLCSSTESERSPVFPISVTLIKPVRSRHRRFPRFPKPSINYLEHVGRNINEKMMLLVREDCTAPGTPDSDEEMFFSVNAEIGEPNMKKWQVAYYPMNESVDHEIEFDEEHHTTYGSSSGMETEGGPSKVTSIPTFEYEVKTKNGWHLCHIDSIDPAYDIYEDTHFRIIGGSPSWYDIVPRNRLRVKKGSKVHFPLNTRSVRTKSYFKILSRGIPPIPFIREEEQDPSINFEKGPSREVDVVDVHTYLKPKYLAWKIDVGVPRLDSTT